MWPGARRGGLSSGAGRGGVADLARAGIQDVVAVGNHMGYIRVVAGSTLFGRHQGIQRRTPAILEYLNIRCGFRPSGHGPKHFAKVGGIDILIDDYYPSTVASHRCHCTSRLLRVSRITLLDEYTPCGSPRPPHLESRHEPGLRPHLGLHHLIIHLDALQATWARPRE